MHLFVPLKFSVTCFLRLTTFIPSKVIYDFILRWGLHLFFVFFVLIFHLSIFITTNLRVWSSDAALPIHT